MKRIKIIAGVLFTLIVLNFSPAGAEAHNSADLYVGSTGQEVKELQASLQALGYFHADTTGYYGPITKNAVERFQADFNITSTGYTGPLTRNMMDQIEMIAHVVHGEARGESYEGQVAVAAVILNRIESSAFPNTTYEVVFQRNAFTAVNDGQYWLSPSTTAFRAVKDAFFGWDPSYGATYYYNPSGVTDTWIFSRDVIRQIGNHHFAR
ncbi:cell wall hydrolase [Planococcus lenghuensis]|uniref:Cell wall hydrolase n=1 Tax=Planococcus lenghuensis TaxID=2213202 RepID=A0A1Q2L4C0_9BACL|nr:cell wall hydrolase [Planococcus lenghuensis]AQQ55224.1 cell wall hydrolase [Planococcus lenghuensis]AQQ55281.1 cell wall hydrolase [Planococcus lenghuensis]